MIQAASRVTTNRLPLCPVSFFTSVVGRLPDEAAEGAVPDVEVPDAEVPDAGVPDRGSPDTGISEIEAPDVVSLTEELLVEESFVNGPVGVAVMPDPRSWVGD
jgi:hypothetical protein